jgi:hypothetical protein
MSEVCIGSLKTVVEQISKYKLDLVGIQEVRWDRDVTEPVGEYTFFCGKGNENHELDTGIIPKMFQHPAFTPAVSPVPPLVPLLLFVWSGLRHIVSNRTA